jgi:cathepsin B
MRVLVLITLALVASTLCQLKGNKKDFITEEVLEKHKTQSSFEMYSYEEHPFKGWSEGDIQSLVGLSKLSLRDTNDITYTVSSTEDLPERFDSREKWPSCIHPIRNQGHCGSCWAHAASEVLSDRFCIASNGQIDVVLSPEDMVTCDYFDHGCSGGILTTSWVYLRFFGIVSDKCKPYTAQDGKVASCPFTTKKCRTEGEQYKKYHAKSFYSPGSIEEIKRNILEKGPIESGFSVYDDFLSYKSGVYKKGGAAKFLGGHAVKIVGWGKQNDTEYWIVANSWGEQWGETGFFNIGFKECGIENVITGDPDLTK